MSDLPHVDRPSGAPEHPPSPARPPERDHGEPHEVTHSSQGPWFPSAEANRPDAPNPLSWATPPVAYHEHRPEQPTPAPRPPQEFVSRFGVMLLAVAIVVAGAVVAISIATSNSTAGPKPVATPSPTFTPRPRTDVHGPERPASAEPNKSMEQIPRPEPGVLPEAQWEPIPDATAQDPLGLALQANPLYGVAAPDIAGCPEPAVPRSDQEWRDAVREQWRCLHESWVPILEANGWSTAMPEVFFYPGRGSKSDCGYFEAPAFYCGANEGSVYFGGDHLRMAQGWDLSVNEMVNHEYGHHLQRVSGITDAWRTDQTLSKDSSVRRSELQAVCWSAMMTYRNTAVGFDAGDYESWGNRLETMEESRTHGTREALVRWGTRGLYAETLGDCNTWTSPEGRVN